jgi:hypothetical protein
VQSSPNVSFSADDHLIRGLMSFIKMTSRELTVEDVIWKGGAPNYFRGRQSAQRRFNFIFFEFEYRKSRTIKGGHYN